MSPEFPLAKLHLWEDPTPRDGPQNMAYDEAMLRQAVAPWLRVYQWREPSISIGFSQPLSKVPPSQAGWPVVRRWTGGGVVVHDCDWTYTLAVPADCPLAQLSAAVSYHQIHAAFIAAMEACQLPGAVLQPKSLSDGRGVCFVEPALFDVVWRGQKVAGAAQRRTKAGLLHQGSVLGVPLPADFAATFARHLAQEVIIEAPAAGDAFQAAVAELVEQKYGRPEWLHDRKTNVP